MVGTFFGCHAAPTPWPWVFKLVCGLQSGEVVVFHVYSIRWYFLCGLCMLFSHPKLPNGCWVGSAICFSPLLWGTWPLLVHLYWLIVQRHLGFDFKKSSVINFTSFFFINHTKALYILIRRGKVIILQHNHLQSIALSAPILLCPNSDCLSTTRSGSSRKRDEQCCLWRGGHWHAHLDVCVRLPGMGVFIESVSSPESRKWELPVWDNIRQWRCR